MCLPVLSIEIDVRDVVKMGIGPEEPVTEIVNGERVGPRDAVIPGEQAREIGSVETHATDVTLQVPRGEEEVALARVNDNGPGVCDARVQRFALGAVQLTDVQVARVPVQPVDLASNPVDGQALQSVTVVADHRLLGTGSVYACPDKIIKSRDAFVKFQKSILPENGFSADVGKEDFSRGEIKVESDRVHQVPVRQVVPGAVQSHVPDVVLVAEHQPRLDFVLALARFLICGSFVVRLGALAVK